MQVLTSKQREILNFLDIAVKSDGYWPSIREIQEFFGFKSTNAVVGHLRALERKGYISRAPGHARAYHFKNNYSDLRQEEIEVESIPVLGSIAAGYPDRIEAGGEIDRLQVDAHTARARRRGANIFAIRVSGDSMINAGIDDGDTVVIETREPRDGEIVAALIDGEVTLKRFILNPGSSPYLKAENPDYPQLFPIDELQVQGVARAVVKQL